MVSNQAYLFLVFIVNGILIGLLFDFFRIARKVIQTNDIVTYLEDILFWILTGAIVLYSIFVFNNGELRLFMFLGILLGAFAYMITLSSYVIKINVKIIEGLKKVFAVIFLPIKVVYQLVHKLFFKPINFLFINIRKNFTNFGTKIFKNLKVVKKQKNIVKN
ncbi:MAG: spore cortex biosynthesis protein YabQ [Clostridia bacterium]|nr:spore cortex biosynthesis protein YabQ [Clostridia bacterium]